MNPLNSYGRLTSGEISDETESHQKLHFGKKCQTVVDIIYLHLSTLKYSLYFQYIQISTALNTQTIVNLAVEFSSFSPILNILFEFVSQAADCFGRPLIPDNICPNENLGRSGNLAVKFLIEVFADLANWQLQFLHLANIVSSYISYRGQYSISQQKPKCSPT